MRRAENGSLISWQQNMAPSPARVREAAQTLSQSDEEEDFVAKLKDLRRALEPPRLRLLKQFNSLEEGIKFLVDLRADFLALKRGAMRQDTNLRAINDELYGLLSSWFDVGFLELRQVTWDAPAALLEKLVAYEAVHEIQSWADLKNRLDSDRRCYAFFHPGMSDEPLIFVEVALVDGMAEQVQTLLDESQPVADADKADTAIFYSISNAQKGLAGVSFGNFLIKRVVRELAHDFPKLKSFATLSPIPGFYGWLKDSFEAGKVQLLPAEVEAIQKKYESEDPTRPLLEVFGSTAWIPDESAGEIWQPILLRLCGDYLRATRVDASGRVRAIDPVAHFHLTNGARVERINWLGDTSAKGMGQSAGLMVNYLYKLSDIDRNHDDYADRGKIRVSNAVRSLG